MNSIRECSAFIADYPGPVKGYDGVMASSAVRREKGRRTDGHGFSKHIRALSRFSLPLPAHGAFAQQSADIDAVKAASKAFYEAVVVVDDGTAMEKVWAQTPYVTYVGPRSTAIIVGWEGSKEILE